MRHSNIYLLVTACLFTLCVLVHGSFGLQKKSRNLVIGYFWHRGRQYTEHYTSVRQNYKHITHLCPTRIAIKDTDGNVVSGKDKWLLAFGKQHGIAILPLVANSDFSREIAHEVLNDESKRTKVINQLLEIITEWKCPGINIDIENVDPSDREAFNTFMKELCDQFHKKGLAVTVDVPAKTKDVPTGYWSGAYDYKFLGKCCDLVMLMCYDEHWSTGKPGPIASRSWVRRCLEYATSTIPAHKVILGCAWYGYDWPEGGRAKAYTSKGIKDLIEERKPILQWDNEAKSHWFEYTDNDGIKHTVWFEDPQSMAHKLHLAREFGIAGISIWRLGNEDPRYWDLLARYRAGHKIFK